jgi:outer membrane protein assembly factor BamE
LGFASALPHCVRFATFYSNPPAADSKSDMTKFFRTFRGTLLPVLLAAVLSACSNLPRMPDVPLLLAPYRIDVQQGNVVTQDMVSQLKPGMSREQVKFVLGTPLVTDMFHTNRWDYIYRLERGKGGVEERKLTVFFDNDALARVEGDVVPQGALASLTAPAKPDAAAPDANKAADAKTPDAAAPADKPAQPKKGFFARLWEKLGF